MGSASGRLWVGFSAEQAVAWVTSTCPPGVDGVYKVRIQGYNLVAGNLVPVHVPEWGRDPSQNPPSEVIVAIDNASSQTRCMPRIRRIRRIRHGARLYHRATPILKDDPVRTMSVIAVEACGQHNLHDSDTVEIRFYAYDPNFVSPRTR